MYCWNKYLLAVVPVGSGVVGLVRCLVWHQVVWLVGGNFLVALWWDSGHCSDLVCCCCIFCMPLCCGCGSCRNCRKLSQLCIGLLCVLAHLICSMWVCSYSLRNLVSRRIFACHPKGWYDPLFQSYICVTNSELLHSRLGYLSIGHYDLRHWLCWLLHDCSRLHQGLGLMSHLL